MLAATGSDSLILAELNHAQLLRLYIACISKAQDLHPNGITHEAYDAAMQMIAGQSMGLINAREVLSNAGLTPGNL